MTATALLPALIHYTSYGAGPGLGRESVCINSHHNHTRQRTSLRAQEMASQTDVVSFQVNTACEWQDPTPPGSERFLKDLFGCRTSLVSYCLGNEWDNFRRRLFLETQKLV